MYCLEKLQRELAYFFDMDLRELPKVESLLAGAGYTQIRKGNDIIEIDSALKLESQAGKEASAEPPAQKSLFDAHADTPSLRADENGAAKQGEAEASLVIHKTNTQEPTAPKVDSSVEPTPPKDTLESTSNPPPSQPPQAQRLRESLQIPLTDDRGLQSLAFGRVGSDAEIMEQVLIPQARNAYRKGTSQNKLEAAARNTLKKHRQALEQSLNITPIKEFGTNYAEHYHSGQSAIQKLLLERNGQVAGAFYRKELGDIDLVWGDSNFGLAHILQERTKQQGDEKALKFISHLSENIEKGQIVELEKGRVGIKTDLTTIILDKKENNNFVLTAFRDRNNKKELESLI